MTKIRTALERKLPLIALLILTVQPLLDVLSYFLGEMGSNTLSTLLRFALLAAVALLGFLVSDRKRLYFLFYGVAALFWVLHAANCFRIGYKSFFADTSNFLRILSFPIFALSFLTFFRRGKEVRRSVYTGIAINFGEILLFTLLPWILGRPVYTYDRLQIGIMGWFGVANAQSAIIVLAVPLTLYWALRTEKYPVFLGASALCFSLMFFTGTKLTFYSIFIIAGAYCFLFVLNLQKKSLRYVLPLLAIMVLAFGLRRYSPMSVREQQSATALGNYGALVEKSLENSGADAETIRIIKNGVDADNTSQAWLERIRRSLFGVYTDRGVYGSFLGDLHQRFGVYRVMEAYGYTSEPAVLSDSRVRKTVFARLMWAEKDSLTKLLGFEYSDMLTSENIYDLENDFPAVFYFCGYLGFGLYLIFLGYLCFVVLRAFVRDVSACARERGKQGKLVLRGLGSFWAGVRRFLTVEMGAVGMTFLLAMIAAQISGNVLRRPNVTVYFAAVAAYLYELTVLRRKKVPEPEEDGF